MLAAYIFGGTISYFVSYDLFVILTLSTLFELALLCMLQLNHIK